MFSVTYELQGLPKRTNNARANWRAKHREAKKWRQESYFALLAALSRAHIVPVPTFSRATLELTRFSSVQPDYDGLVSSFKHVIDGIVDTGIIPNDKMETIGIPNYLWKKCPQKEGFVRITISEGESNG